MKQKFVALLCTLVLLCATIMPSFSVFADSSVSSGTFSVDSVCPTCGKPLTYKWWSTLGAEVELSIIDNAKITIPSGSGALGKLTERCGSCGYEKIEWKCLGLQGGDSKPGKINATQAPSGIGRKDLPGYADDNGTSSVNSDGNLTFVAKYRFSDDRYHFVDSFSITDTDQDANKIWNFGSSSIQIESYSQKVSDVYAYGGYVLDTQNISGIFYIPKGTAFVYNPWGTYEYHDIGFGWKSFETDSIWSHSCDGSKQYLILYRYNDSTKKPDYMYSNENGTDILFYQDSHLRCRYIAGVSSGYPDDLVVYCRPTSVTVNKQTNITINNITWNGNIYTDNSTNLTYIYPQYTTVNEKNETVTNISTNPIIYNNETKQYYTYDQTTKNYYYIYYGSDSPTPSPTPDPSPKPTPGGSGAGGGGDVSTPETGKPGGSSGSSWWDKLLGKIGDAIIDGLLGAVSAVLKLIFKLFSTILSWIIWAVSRVFDLLPFLPPGLGGLLVGGVVVCFVIGIIKFIRG